MSEPDLTLRYDDHRDAILDVHLPPEAREPGPTAAPPLVVVVHGGFWKAEWDRTHTRPQARALADLGCLVVTPEYRRVRAGGGWPVTGTDVRRAVDAAPDLLAARGLRHGRRTAVGHSAGGQLVLWLAATGAALDHVVALAPVCDLREAVRLGLGDDATPALLGDSPVEDADPMTLLERRPGCSVTVVHGDADEPVPVGLSRGLVARHPWIRYVELPGVGHRDLVEPTSAAWPTVVEAVLPEA